MLKLEATNAPRYLAKLSNSHRLVQRCTKWRSFQTKGVVCYSLAAVSGHHQVDYGFIPSSPCDVIGFLASLWAGLVNKNMD